MSDDDRPGHGAPRGHAPATAGVDPVVLPEHASAYYSPRSPPAATAHRTLEVAAVRLDQSVDPRFSDTQRVNVDGLEPPPWLGGSAPLSDAPTVLLPIVRARRFRKRAGAGFLAVLVGSGLGIWFGLTREPNRGSSDSSSAGSPSVTSTLPRSAVSGPPGAESVPSVPPASSSVKTLAPVAAGIAAEAPLAPGPLTGKEGGVPARGRAVPRRVASAAPAWLKSEPPKAWIK